MDLVMASGFVIHRYLDICQKGPFVGFLPDTASSVSALAIPQMKNRATEPTPDVVRDSVADTLP